MKELSLKTKMALAVSLMFVTVIALLAWCTLSFLEKSFNNAISTQQFTLVSSIADNVDDKLRIAQDALIAAASKVPASVLCDADRAQTFLGTRSALFSLFDNGLFLFSRDGKLIAESPYRSGRRGWDISSREFFRETVATGKPHISKPFTSTHNPGHPAILLTVPVFDRQGHLLAILAGGFDLWGKNFLQELSNARLGKSGYFYMTDQDRTIIINHVKSRILTRALPVDANPLYEKALAGFEGERRNSKLAGRAGPHLHQTSADNRLALGCRLAACRGP